jgi:two-component system sensor histidine kinase UhpB
MPSAPSARHPARHPAWRRDLIGLAAAVLLECAAAGWGDWSERYARFALRHEGWQVDEWPLTLLLLALGLCWFAWRRLRELRRLLAEQQAAEARIAELLARNQALARQLVQAQEAERRGLARELHDEFGQGCTAIRIEARLLQRHIEAPEALRQGARRIARSAEQLHALVRALLTRLRPPSLDSLGLAGALRELCETWEAQTGAVCGLRLHLPPQALDDAVAVTVFRLVQEGLTNVARHADADAVRIELQAAGWPQQALWLHLEDNGRGLPDGGPAGQGLGLAGMRERVDALQGRLWLETAAGGGLRIRVCLPGPAGAAMTRVLLIDDHPVVRAGYRRLLELEPGLTVVAECGDADSGYQALCASAPT